MSKPDDIPADVWASAENALDNMLCNCIEASGSSEKFRADNVSDIARAILAERERCAKVAETLFSRTPKEGRKTLYKSQELAVYASELVAAAIRGGTK